MKKILLFFIAVIGMIACGSDENTVDNGQIVEFETLAKGEGPITTNENIENNIFLVNSTSNLLNILNEFGLNMQFDNINFDEQSVIVVIGKNKADSSYDFHINEVIEYSNHISVKTFSQPHGIAQMPSFPYHFIKVKRTEKTVILDSNF